MKPLAVVLVSGGMDSCVTAAVAAREYRLGLLHIGYGQRTQAKELDSFNKISGFYKPEQQLVLTFDYLALIKGSSLTDNALPVPLADPGKPGIPSTYVPFRNAGFLSAAVSWAEVLGAEAVFMGAVEEDSSGYPDCRESFFAAFQEVVERGTKPGRPLSVQTPLIRMTKGEIVRLGISLDAPLHHTWSCYRREDVACGTCASCVLRLRGFLQAGANDPIPYQQKEFPVGISDQPRSTHTTFEGHR